MKIAAMRGLSAGATLIATAFWAVPAAAQQAQPAQPAAGPEQLQEVIVTGSLIKRTDTETPSPVQILSADDLSKSGYTNVNDVLRNLAANGQGTLNQGFTEAFAAGASGIALRGLTVGDTLTLIDGERMVAYPLSDDGERSFVDTTAIPINAIESIEVLKDGASALYGADAIAGVINIKLRQTYEGAQFTGEGGATQHNDGWNWHAAGILGWGDLASDGYNMYVALDWHRQELILGSNRTGPWTTLNWTGLPNGINETPGSPTQSFLTYPDSIHGYLVNPANGAVSFLPTGQQPGCNSQAAQAAGACEFSFPGQIQPPTEQTNFLAKFTHVLGNDWKMVVTASIFDSSAEQVAPETPPFGHALNQTGINTGGNILTPIGPGIAASAITYPVFTLPANSPLNPFGPTVSPQLVYSFPDVGPEVTDVDTTTYRLFADFRGTAGAWDLDASFGAMYALMHDHIYGFLEPGLVQTDLNNGTYVPGVNTNGAALFAPVETTDPSSTLDVIDLHGSRDLFQLPGGPLSLATGVQYFHKALNYVNPPTVISGVQEGASAFAVGSQDDTAAFLELDGKPVNRLEIDAAVRYDHYDTYGGSATPKFGLKYTPVDMLSLRGTWGKGFRAPSIAESGIAGNAFGQGNINDPVLCPGGVANVQGTYNQWCVYPGVGVGAANPQLKAVTSKNATFGVIFEPLQQFNASVDYYWVQLNNDIISASAAGGLGASFLQLVRGAQQVEQVCTNTPTSGPCTTAPVLTPVGIPLYTVVPYVNAGITTTSGIDVDLRTRWDVGPGKLSAELNYTHMIEYDYGFAGTTYHLAGTHGPSSISGDTGNPKDHAVLSLTWDQGPFTSTLSVNYISSFSIVDPSSGYNNCLEAISSGAPSAYGPVWAPPATLPGAWSQYCSVAHFTEVNLYARYQMNEHFDVHGSITNLGNSDAPIDLQTYGGGAELHYDAALEQDGAVGRMFMLGATYKW